VSQTWTRIEAFIKCLQRNMMQLFDFVIEDTEEAYINIYLVRQAGEGYIEKMVTLAEFKERFSLVQELK
jgi:hypothetical protein